MSQVKFVNDAIDSARSGSPLYKMPHIKDPSDEIVAVHLAALKWNVLQRRFGLVASELAALQRSSVELLCGKTLCLASWVSATQTCRLSFQGSTIYRLPWYYVLCYIVCDIITN